MEKKIYEVPATELTRLNVENLLVVGSADGENLGDGGSGSAGGGGAHAKDNVGDDEWEEEGNGAVNYHFSLWD